ncbi:unnamed protein product [Nyctereutes procyonoides]|uniref:(raccoon dog) hypothetical protein n=1 Tax=Nyctereutes procyonoides TaxID=34880 RepID=A0A811Y1Z1_NYCPR|nr:unnamed protein product [Nyctereutes procyonoides]
MGIWRFTTFVRNLSFSAENKWKLLILMTMYFGSGFAYFIVSFRKKAIGQPKRWDRYSVQ